MELLYSGVSDRYEQGAFQVQYKSIHVTAENTMKVKSHSSLLLLVVMLIASSCVRLVANTGGKLAVSAKHPQTGIQQGQVFNLELTLSNPDTLNASVQEIRFNADFFET